MHEMLKSSCEELAKLFARSNNTYVSQMPIGISEHPKFVQAKYFATLHFEKSEFQQLWILFQLNNFGTIGVKIVTNQIDS